MTCTCENVKYVGIIIDDSVVTFDEIIDATKTFPTKSTSTKSTSTKLFQQKVLQQISIFY